MNTWGTVWMKTLYDEFMSSVRSHGKELRLLRGVEQEVVSDPLQQIRHDVHMDEILLYSIQSCFHASMGHIVKRVVHVKLL